MVKGNGKISLAVQDFEAYEEMAFQPALVVLGDVLYGGLMIPGRIPLLTGVIFHAQGIADFEPGQDSGFFIHQHTERGSSHGPYFELVQHAQFLYKKLGAVISVRFLLRTRQSG